MCYSPTLHLCLCTAMSRPEKASVNCSANPACLIFCGLFSHDQISDGCMFIHTTRPSLRRARAAQTRTYAPAGNIAAMLAQVFADYRFSEPYADLPADLRRLEAQLRENLPDWVCKDPDLKVELFSSVLYRNKGAYLVGRIYTRDEQWPLVIPLLHREGQGIQIDALITDEADVSIIFSFTRSYFMVDVPVPAEFIGFLRRILPGKHIAELYTSIGFYKHGKSEFYRALINHLATTDDQFIMAPGVRGMVMSVFTLPGFNTVFKIIKDRFSPSKNVNRATVKDVADGLVEIWGRLIREKGLDFIYDSERAPTQLYNQTLLQSVMGNLLRNAWHYTDHGFIRLTLGEQGFSVEDSGIGIPDDKREAMFQPFVRGDQNRGEGLGLGLSLVQRICGIQQWRVALTARQPNGCCFSVALAMDQVV